MRYLGGQQRCQVRHLTYQVPCSCAEALTDHVDCRFARGARVFALAEEA
jgi:hypothetical protein